MHPLPGFAGAASGMRRSIPQRTARTRPARLRWSAALALVTACILGVSSASAVQFGEPDGDGHPYVGLIAFYHDDVLVRRCTGALLSERLVLTAGHCTGGWSDPAAPEPQPDSAQLFLQPGPIETDPAYVAAVRANGGAPVDCFAGAGGAPLFPGYPCAGGIRGTPQSHPDWAGTEESLRTRDIGVVHLDAAVSVGRYAVAATPGTLDTLRAAGKGPTALTVVGYGLQGVRPVLSEVRLRMRGTVAVLALDTGRLGDVAFRHSGNRGRATGPGAACLGDSGAPLLDGDTVVGVFSYVLNDNCRGGGVAFRVDSAAAQAFLSSVGN